MGKIIRSAAIAVGGAALVVTGATAATAAQQAYAAAPSPVSATADITAKGSAEDPQTTLSNNTDETLYAITAYYGGGPATLAPHTTYILGDGHTRNAYGAAADGSKGWQEVDIYRNNPSAGDNATNCLGTHHTNPGFGCTTDHGGTAGQYTLTLG